MAAPVEDAAWIYYHTGRVNFARNDAFGFYLNAPLGKDHTIEAAGNNYAIALDLTLDFGTLAQDDRLFRDDVSFYVAVNAERTFDGKRSLKGHALVDETCPLFAASALCCRAGPLPRHRKPPKMTHTTLTTLADKSTKRCDGGVESGDVCDKRRRRIPRDRLSSLLHQAIVQTH